MDYEKEDPLLEIAIKMETFSPKTLFYRSTLRVPFFFRTVNKTFETRLTSRAQLKYVFNINVLSYLWKARATVNQMLQVWNSEGSVSLKK